MAAAKVHSHVQPPPRPLLITPINATPTPANCTPAPPTPAGILYSIYPPLFGALLVYSVGGTALSVYIGRPLVGLNFQQEAQEANFRCGCRLRVMKKGWEPEVVVAVVVGWSICWVWGCLGWGGCAWPPACMQLEDTPTPPRPTRLSQLRPGAGAGERRVHCFLWRGGEPWVGPLLCQGTA